MNRILATTALVGALTVTGAAAASAYPANPAIGGVDTGTTTPGGSVDLSGTGMTPGETVVVTIDCTVGEGAASTSSATVVANGNGAFVYTAVMNTAGQCGLAAVGAASGAMITAQVTVASQVTTQSASSGTGQAASSGTGRATSSGTGQAASSGSDEAASSGSGLANTGIDTPIALWGAAGVGALTLGAAAVVVSRRRNDATTS